MSEFLLEVKDAFKSFKAVKALNGFDFSIKPGEIKCLIGENGCGKSTLIKAISGVYKLDQGSIIIEGKTYSAFKPIEAIAAGIQVIYQDFSLFPNLSVAENITMAHSVYTKGQWVNKKNNYILAKRVLDDLGVSLNLDDLVRDVSVAERQIIAICRALLLDAKLIIMDEPTTALTSKEIAALFDIIEGMKKRGIALIFVSHKLDEVLAIAESVCIMRNGENVIDGPIEEFDKASLSYYMTGKNILSEPFKAENIGSKPLFSVRNLTLGRYFRNISFELYQGEILGITGLLGSGRTELAEAIFGIRRPEEGQLFLNGKEVKIKESYDAVNAGIGYLPEDRLTKGVFLDVSIERNIAAGVIRKFSQQLFNITDKRLIKRNVGQQVDLLQIKTDNIKNPVSSLSGGNQQRVVLAKWLAINPQVLILNCPTVGVDINSKQSIHDEIKRLVNKGICVIVISDDLPEILSLTSRVLVMNKGKFSYEFETAGLSESTLQKHMIRA